jgi:hypothetical protein
LARLAFGWLSRTSWLDTTRLQRLQHLGRTAKQQRTNDAKCFGVSERPHGDSRYEWIIGRVMTILARENSGLNELATLNGGTM